MILYIYNLLQVILFTVSRSTFIMNKNALRIFVILAICTLLLVGTVAGVIGCSNLFKNNDNTPPIDRGGEIDGMDDDHTARY